MNRICRKNQGLLSAYVDGMLPEKAKKSFAAHLDSCPECRQALRETELLRELLREFPEKHPGPGFETAILSRVKEKKPEVAALRSWSRRVSYGLAGLALLLIVTIYLQRPVLPPHPEVVRTPAPSRLAAERKKAESISEQKSPVFSDATSERQEEAPEPSSVKAKVTTEMQAAVSLPVGSSAPAEYAAVPEKEVGEHAVALQKTAGVFADKESRLLVIRNKTDWEKTWNFQNTRQNLSLPLPKVDFTKQMVVALPTNQAGRDYKIVKTEEKPDRIIVQYRVIPPGQDEAGIMPPYQIEVVNTRPSVELQKLD